MGRPRTWSDDDLDDIERLYGEEGRGRAHLEEWFGEPWACIRQALKYHRPAAWNRLRSNRLWSDHQLDHALALREQYSTSKTASMLGCSPGSLRQALRRYRSEQWKRIRCTPEETARCGGVAKAEACGQ